MVSDRVRTEAYQKALAAAVRPGDVVLDVGAGTGIMGMLAAQAGAKKVYCVERAGIATVARRLVEQNGFGDRVEVIQAEVEDVVLPERADVIVGEWMGCYGVDENLLPPMLVARDRWLKPDGKLLPEIVTAWLAPVEDAQLAERIDFWRTRPYGLDFAAVAEASVNEVRMGQHHITGVELLAVPRQLWATDVRTISVTAAHRPFGAEMRFAISRSGRLSALAAWFEARFPNGSTLTNAPDATWTHWGRSVFPLCQTMEVSAGVPVEVRLTCEPAQPGYCHQRWSVRVSDGEWEHHDTRREVTLPQ
jgi:SAM-dependent methyltransferase